MPYLTVVRMQGDPDELLRVKRERSEATSADPALQGAKDASGAGAVPLAYEHYDVEQFELIRS